MIRSRKLKDIIVDTEYKLEKYKFVLSKFPDAQILGTKHFGFKSETVNHNYDKIEFIKDRRSLSIARISIIEFEYNGKKENIIIHSSPLKRRLAYLILHRDWRKRKRHYIMKFSEFSRSLKDNEFDNKIINDCCLEILNFINTKNNYDIDKSKLDPRIDKILFLT